MFTIADLITPATRAEMVDTLLSLADTFGLPTTAWQSGQVIRTWILTAGAKLADLTTVVTEIARGGFGDLASDAWATKWAKGNYGVDRLEADAARGTLNVINFSGNSQDFAPGELIVAHATTGKTYRNADTLSIPEGDEMLLDPSVPITVAADEVGTASNAAPGTITTVVNGIPGFTCSNPGSLLGNDKERRDVLVARARLKLAARSPDGPKEAYEFVALDPDLTVTSERITRVQTVADGDTGEIAVYLATASGAPSGGDITIAQAALDKWAEPWCTNATAIASSDIVIPVTYQVWLQGSQLTDAQVTVAVSLALGLYFASTPIGGFIIDPGGLIFVDSIRQVIGTSVPGVLRVLVTLPAADVVIAEGEVPVLGAVTGTVTRVT